MYSCVVNYTSETWRDHGAGRRSVIELRHDDEIHREDGGWFSARWHFSFGSYRDPAQMGVGPLRVFNDDRLVPGAVWPLHPHRDIEGITYVIEGTFRHEDSEGNGGILLPGAVQRATLGSGMWHSEQNGSTEEPVRFLQFWILPDTADLPPSVEQRQYAPEDRANRLLRVVGPEGGDVIKVHQDASVHVGRLEPGAEVIHGLGKDRGAYLYLIEGRAELDGQPIATGAAARILDQPEVRLRADAPSEVILVDVPLRWTPVGVWARG
jgi:redox-sensitive bicupin YhaK (pirin superfamily)